MDNTFQVNTDFKRYSQKAIQEFVNDNADSLPKGDHITMNIDATTNGNIALTIYSRDQTPDKMDEARKLLETRYGIKCGTPQQDGRGSSYYAISAEVSEQQFYRLLENIDKDKGKAVADKIKPDVQKMIREAKDGTGPAVPSSGVSSTINKSSSNDHHERMQALASAANPNLNGMELTESSPQGTLVATLKIGASPAQTGGAVSENKTQIG